MNVDVSEDNILLLLGAQEEQFPAIAGIVNQFCPLPSSVFIPQTVQHLSNQFTHNIQLVYELYSYLELINLYSFVIYKDPNFFMNGIMESLKQTRVINNLNLVLAKETIGDFLFSTEEELINFIINNKLLLGVYVYTLVRMSLGGRT